MDGCQLESHAWCISAIAGGIACTKCDAELVSATRGTLIFRGKPPIEIATDPAGTMIMVCSACGNLVPIDADLLVVH